MNPMVCLSCAITGFRDLNVHNVERDTGSASETKKCWITNIQTKESGVL